MQAFGACGFRSHVARGAMQSEFKDQVVVVTGAAQGLGLSIARKFARDQAIVFMTDLQAEKLGAAARALE